MTPSVIHSVSRWAPCPACQNPPQDPPPSGPRCQDPPSWTSACPPPSVHGETPSSRTPKKKDKFRNDTRNYKMVSTVMELLQNVLVTCVMVSSTHEQNRRTNPLSKGGHQLLIEGGAWGCVNKTPSSLYKSIKVSSVP